MAPSTSEHIQRRVANDVGEDVVLSGHSSGGSEEYHEDRRYLDVDLATSRGPVCRVTATLCCSRPP